MSISTIYDRMNEHELLVTSLDFLKNGKSGDDNLDSIEYAYHALSPRVNFVKNLKEKSTLLDLGAGDGGLSVFRRWPLYERADLRMLALSLDIGEKFGDYDAYEIKNFEGAENVFEGENINAVVCAHFIEHMNDPTSTIQFIAKRVSKEARIYIEWPHEISKKMPSRKFFLDQGINISTTRFDDDSTHIEAWNMDFIVDLLESNGFLIEALGRVHFPFIGSKLRDIGTKDNHIIRQTLAFWTYFGWSQYLVAVKQD